MDADNPAAREAAAFRALEEAWAWFDRCGIAKGDAQAAFDNMLRAQGEYREARRAALAADYVPVMISREAVEASRELIEKCTCMCPYARRVKQVLARDLVDEIKR